MAVDPVVSFEKTQLFLENCIHFAYFDTTSMLCDQRYVPSHRYKYKAVIISYRGGAVKLKR